MTQLITTTRKRVRGNGEGSVIKLSGKRTKPYAARVTIGWSFDGKQVVKYVGYYKTKSEAKKALNEYLINPYDLNKITTQNIFDDWEKTAKVSDEVIKAYRNAVKNSGLANKVFKDIKLMQLENAARDLTPSMQKRFRNAFKNLYEYAMRHDMVNKNLADLMELDKYTAGKKEALTSKEIKEIFKGEDLIPTILLLTGMRIGELFDVRAKNVDLEKRIIIGGKKTAAGTDRSIPIHERLIPIFEELLKKGTTYLITNDKGNKVIYDTYLKGVWYKNPLSEKHTPHSMRHTFISRAVKLELNQEVLKAIVGHSSGNVTSDVYTHIDNEQLVDFIDGFNY